MRLKGKPVKVKARFTINVDKREKIGSKVPELNDTVFCEWTELMNLDVRQSRVFLNSRINESDYVYM